MCPPENRLSAETFNQLHDLLCQAGTRVARDAGSLARLNELRAMYEPYVECLSQHIAMGLPPFYVTRPRKDNWQTVAQLSNPLFPGKHREEEFQDLVEGQEL